MNSNNHEYRTTETSLAAYLVSEGFPVAIIEYDEKHHGTYVFDDLTPKLKQFVLLFQCGKATANIAVYEHIRNGLIDRVKRGMP